jgi:hypothetical protein
VAEEQWKSVGVRLSTNADSLLRSMARRKGDIGELLRTAIVNTNWDEVELVQRRKTYQPFWKTSFLISDQLYEELKQHARKRGVEVSALIDGIVVSYYSRKQQDNS